MKFVFILYFSTLPAAKAVSDLVDESKFCSTNIERMETKKTGDYRITISHAHDRMCQRLHIFKHGQMVFHEEGIDNHYSFGSGDHDKYALGNLIGHGTQLVLTRWTGGAHCCMSLLIFDLGNQFKKIAEIDGGNFDPEIVDFNHDGIPQIRVTDDFLAYRFSSFASSAKGEVILKYADEHYAVAPEFMKKPAPSTAALNTQAALWKKLLQKRDSPEWPPPPMIQSITDLIFTGNKKIAFDLIDRAWPSGIPGKAEFVKNYTEALAESQYYRDFEATQ